MSLLGRLVYYSASAPDDGEEFLRRLLNLFAPKLVICAWSKKYEQPAWNSEGRIPFDPSMDEDEWLSFGRCLLNRKAPDELFALAPFQNTITVSLGEGPRAEVFCEGLNVEIPESIRGDFVPWKPVVSIGHHDIIYGDMSGHIRVAHAVVSITMQCQTTPLNTIEYGRIVFETRAARSLQADLEAICGPLKHWIGWDV